MIRGGEDAVGQIVTSFSAAALDPSKWMDALSHMSDVIGSDSSALELVDFNAGSASLNCTYPMDRELVDLYEERIFQINPRVRRVRKIPVGVMVDDRSLLIEGDPDMSEFMDWLDKTPNRYISGAKLYQGEGHEIYFGSYFSKSHGPPQAWHRDIHRAVIPHLVNFVAVGRALSANKLNSELLRIDDFNGGRSFALLDSTGRIVECSAGFEMALAATNLLSVHRKILVATHPRHSHKVQGFLQSALGPRRLLAKPASIRLSSPECRHGLVLRAVPLQPGESVFDIFKPAALITLIYLDEAERVKRDELMELFELTPREADVAVLIGTGATTDEATQRLRMSRHTVRQHIKAVFGKTGVSRQAELVALFSRLR